MNRKDLKQFEENYNMRIPSQSTVIIRVDGKNFSKITRQLEKPFDKVFSSIMISVMKEMAPRIDGCKLAYTQSDEISFMLSNKEYETPYFGNRIQKIASISAADASVCFYKTLLQFILNYQDQADKFKGTEEEKEKINKRIKILWDVLNSQPLFDAKVFSVPNVDDKMDAIELRQNNCIANGINLMARLYLPEFEGKSQKELLIELRKIDQPWEQMDDIFKYGCTIIRDDDSKFQEFQFLGEKALFLREKTNGKS